jgi:lipoate---protein ligase
MSATDKPFRVIATGLRGGRANIAFDQALIEARRQERIPDTIRFLRFRPSALIGVHQYLSHELKLDYCTAHGIETVRRITGGGGLYFDEGQIGWELVFDRATLGVLDLAEVTRRICEAAALGLQKLGVPAHYRPRNDIEVDGRKISGTGGFFDGNLIFYQGTLLIDFDPAKMLACLNVPAEKLAKRPMNLYFLGVGPLNVRNSLQQCLRSCEFYVRARSRDKLAIWYRGK